MLMDAIGAKFQQFLSVDRFMTPGNDNPAPDLAFLLLFAPIKNDPLKFDAVAPYIRITNVGATDIHRNVELPSMCPGGVDSTDTCKKLAAKYPNLAQNLVTGGAAILSDGDRFDSYARGFRWMANRTLVKQDATSEPEEIRQAIGHGRSYLAFDLLGAPEGFDFFALADGQVVEQGQEVTGALDVTLYVHAPTLVAPPWGLPHVTDFSNAQVETRLIRATADGSTQVVAVTSQGASLEWKADQAAAWRVEVWVTPRHLAPALNGFEDLAEQAYPYVYSNAVFVR